MSHKSVRQLIETTVRSIQDDIKFSYGLDEDFDQDKKNSFTFCNLSPLNSSPSFADNDVLNYSKAWRVEMTFYKYDDKAKTRQYITILDTTDNLCDRFITRLNLTETIKLTNFNQQPFIYTFSDILTGHLLSFVLTPNDDNDYCEDC